jgi:drug/metabolite transporter (DMT)-like permease
VLGAAFFGDWPDATALLGAAVIIGSGLFLWRRGTAPEPAKTDL